MRNTKIIATIGNASLDYEVMKSMVEAGLNVVRINLSHAKLEMMERVVENVKKIRKELNVALPIMIDTRGPELRVKTFENGSVDIKKGQKFIFTGKTVKGDENQVSINMPSVIPNIKVGSKILACDGLITFKVLSVKDKEIVTKAMNSGTIFNRKSLCIPGLKLNTPYLNTADKLDIVWAIKNDVELIAASFVNTKDDVVALRNFITKRGGNMKIISKIESVLGVKNLDEIIEVSDGVMVARGDLGVEIPIEKLPEIQKMIISKVVRNGKTVVTATEMLESMIENSRPTRAEVCDIANSIYDGTSCIMLSGETAIGKNPVEAVKTMSDIALETEKYIEYYNDYCDIESGTAADFISKSAAVTSFSQDIKCIFSFTTTGTTAGLISRFRPATTIVGATPNETVYRQLDLRWGVLPMLTPVYKTTDEMFKIANDMVKQHKIAKPGDKIVVTCGTPHQPAGTNLLKIVEVE